MLRGKSVGHDPRPLDVDELQAAAMLLFDPDASVQIQGLPSGRWRICRSNDVPAILAAARDFSDDKGVYFSLNPCRPDQTRPIRVGDVLRRRLLLLDFDAVRPADSNSTEEEKQAVAAVAQKACAYLRDKRGWPEPVKIDSGNGYHGCYFVDLPNNDKSRVLIRELIQTLADRFDTPEAKIDRKVHNANRVSKLPGTWAGKGPHSAERPHRLCRILSAPAHPQIVTLEQLQAVLEDNSQREAKVESNGEERPRSRFVGKAVGGEESREAAYARAALRDEFYAVANENPDGHQRNNRLNEAAFKMGTLIGAGVIDRAEVEQALLRAALACGLPADEAQRTIQSGIEAGILQPRTMPERNGRMESPEGWDDPLPLGELPKVELFPLEVLPEPCRQLVEEIAWAMNCAPDLAALALLSLASGAIGNARHLAITETHVVSSCLYAVVVAPPGMAKSPPLKLLQRPFNAAEKDYRKEWKAALAQWKEAEKDERGPRPILRRCQVSNTTTESLKIILDENPRGVVLIRNELSGLVAGLNQYKRGGDDRQFYIDLWDGSPIIDDRKSDRQQEGAPVFVLDAFTTIYGTIQPDVIAIMRLDLGGRRVALNDGWLDRFLFSFPADLPAAGDQGRAVSAGARMAWDNAVKELLSLRMRRETDEPPRPVELLFSPGGQASWKRFTAALAAEMNEEAFPPHLQGPWVKLRAYAGRLALILRCLRWACRGMADDDLDIVDKEDMDGAVRLIGYFKSHTSKVYLCLDANPRLREAKRVLRWLANSLKTLKCLKSFQVVTRSELHAGVWGGSKDVDEVERIVQLLERYGWLRLLAEEDNRRGPGRKPSPRYEVHPAVFTL
jgi:hypothetical protein